VVGATEEPGTGRGNRLALRFAFGLLALGLVGSAAAASAPARTYWLGSSFDGLALEHGDRTTYIYGTCVPPPDGGCAPPLQVQNWTLHQRHPSMFTRAARCVRGVIRGRPAAVFSTSGGIEVYIGRTVVVLFGYPVNRVMRATRALRPHPSQVVPARLARPPASVQSTLVARCRRGDLAAALKESS
jgi:hypothetical protein